MTNGGYDWVSGEDVLHLRTNEETLKRAYEPNMSLNERAEQDRKGKYSMGRKGLVWRIASE